MMKLSIIIVNYNVTDLLRNCLNSIKKYVIGISYEVIVVDNLSTDTTWKSLIGEFPDFIFFESGGNLGFSKANNLAVQKAKGEYLLLLNPDTEFESNCMQSVLDFVDSVEKFGCLGARMHNEKGMFLPESKRSVPKMFNSFEKLFIGWKYNTAKSYYRTDVAETDIAEVEVVTGAFLLCRKSLYVEVGGLDETYFMYGEDIDICYTFLQKGYHNYYYGKCSILHYKGKSTIKNKEYLQHFFGAMQIFVDKYYSDQPFKRIFLTIGLKIKHFIERSKIGK